MPVKMVVGKFKDECLGQLMRRFAGLRPKLYSFEYDRLAFFDIDEDGNKVEVGKPTEASVQKIIVDTKNVGKGVKHESLTTESLTM